MIKKNKYLITMQHIGYFEKEIEASSVREARIIALKEVKQNWKNLNKDNFKILFVENKQEKKRMITYLVVSTVVLALMAIAGI